MLGARMRRNFSADLMQSVPNQLNRPTLRREIPNIAGDYTMGPTNAAHFSKRLSPIRYKVNYKSRNNDVERVIRERQLLRVLNPKIHSLRDCFLARNFDLWLRRIDRDYCRGRARTDYKISKDSSATTDIEPARISRRCEPIEKDRTDGTGPAAHELLICGAIAKTLRVFGHFAPPSPRLNRRLSALCLHDRSTAEFNANRRPQLKRPVLEELLHRQRPIIVRRSHRPIAELDIEPYRIRTRVQCCVLVAAFQDVGLEPRHDGPTDSCAT